MEKLKLCPFCGGKAKKCRHRRSFSNDKEFYYNIECTNLKCGIIMPTYLNVHDAIKAWNRRIDNKKAAQDGNPETAV
ncbi:Lar family restriction alleviation protein [Pectinatus haikarae]|uniref:Lar family restriction alleviation protein n=1 Tax=Pectinatus haikarae TaxID=349096 RepID=A0ABT9Y3V7_9FIRM|nr:Lar family restriction alleviation protein [Pectinatus haikarae]MDQ0202507.1 Lar family restriction alleviation protein [Pectinatus haikarae]